MRNDEITGEFEWIDAQGSGLVDLRALIAEENQRLEPSATSREGTPSDHPPAGTDIGMPRNPTARALSKELRRACAVYRKRAARARRDRRVLRAGMHLSLAIAGLGALLHVTELLGEHVPPALTLLAGVLGIVLPILTLALFTQERFRHADTRYRRLKRTMDELESIRGHLPDAKPDQIELARRRAAEVVRVLQPEHEHW